MWCDWCLHLSYRQIFIGNAVVQRPLSACDIFFVIENCARVVRLLSASIIQTNIRRKCSFSKDSFPPTISFWKIKGKQKGLLNAHAPLFVHVFYHGGWLNWTRTNLKEPQWRKIHDEFNFRRVLQENVTCKLVGCNNGGGGGNFLKVKRLFAKWVLVGTRNQLFSGFLAARVGF